jgi:hypothetical protein
MKLYQIFAQLADMRKREAIMDRVEQMDMFAGDLSDKYLPHGSGFDIGSNVYLPKSSEQKLVILSAYHPMNEAGMYIGWIDFTVIVRASLIFGYTTEVKGPFSRRNMMSLKDYIMDEFHECLNKNDIHVNFGTLQET